MIPGGLCVVHYFWAAVLGAVQGVAELLPISSSGHLALLHYFLSLGDSVLRTTVVLHIGSLFGIVLYFVAERFRRKHTNEAEKWLGMTPRLACFVICSFVVTGVVGKLLKPRVEEAFGSPVAVAVALVINAGILLTIRGLRSGRKSIGDVGVGSAVLIGLAQGLAVAPGISRFGLTFLAARILGFESREAARYSLILSAPTIAAVAAYELMKGGVTAPWPLLATGVAVAAVAAWLATAAVMAWVRRPMFYYACAGWCLLVGCVVLLTLGNPTWMA